MKRPETRSALANLLLFALLTGAAGSAAAWYPQYGYQQPGGYQPQYPQYQYQYQYPQQYANPYQQPMQAAPRYTPPRVEASISDSSPYEQQSLVYRIRIAGDGNIKTVSPVLPQVTDAVLRSLGDPVSTRSDAADGREMVTEYRYLLMPLASGAIEIPPVRVTGRYTGSGGEDGPAFDVTGNAVRMRVRAAPDAVQPWLPLYNLQITARVRGNEAPAAGNPIEMEVETRAVGATGSQIPSVAPYLASDDFRIYPGRSTSDGTVSADGKTLQGRRVESFTLVPRYGGWLQLPGVSLNWWNVRYNRPEVAALLTDQINVMGPSNPARGGDTRGTLGSAIFWLPMVVAVGMLLFGWLSAFTGDGRLPGTDSFKKLFRPLLGQLYAPMAALAARISPRRSLHRMRTWTGRHLPISWKLWFCLRAVARENDPAEWAHALQILASKHLGVRPQSHLRQLGESIVRCHPGANAGQVDRLLAELDQAVYGTRTIHSFPRWKREFKRQIKPGLFPIRFRQCAVRARLSAELPELNPQ